MLTGRIRAICLLPPRAFSSPQNQSNFEGIAIVTLSDIVCIVTWLGMHCDVGRNAL